MSELKLRRPGLTQLLQPRAGAASRLSLVTLSFGLAHRIHGVLCGMMYLLASFVAALASPARTNNIRLLTARRRGLIHGEWRDRDMLDEKRWMSGRVTAWLSVIHQVDRT